MAWSTTELANLAGTTVNAIRHYHRRQLLDEPERLPNGYKQYTVAHLVQLLQIRRLRDIGVPVVDIAREGARVGVAKDVLRAFDAELEASIERGRRARAEIAEMLEHDAIGGVPAGFAPVAMRMSDAERAMTLVYAQLYDDDAMADVRSLVDADGGDAATTAFEQLPADADDELREHVAAELAEPIARAFRAFPWMAERQGPFRRSPMFTAEAMAQTLTGLYSPAQLDVLGRADTIARRLVAEPDHPEP